MTSATFPYSFQPQPPPHPRTTGGKTGPLTAIPATSVEDGDPTTISDLITSIPVRLTTLDVLSSRPKTKSSIVSVPGLPHSRNPFIVKKPALNSFQSLYNNNNSLTLNFNQVTASSCNNNFPVITVIPVSNNNGNNNTLNHSQSNEKDWIGSETIISTTLNSASSSLLTSQSINVEPDHDILNSTNDSIIPPSSHTSRDNGSNVSATSNSGSSSTTADTPTESLTSPSDQNVSSLTNFAYEHDHDYESVGSPCSSTASGPIYVRPAGFTHHAQEIEAPHVKNKLKKKKYLTSLVTVREGIKKREATPPKLRPKREPLPMKLRALPQSFWQQPNVAHQVSPATLFLPPLQSKDSEEVLMDVLPASPPEEKDVLKKQPAPERKLIVTNTDLLFKLFDGVDEGKKSSSSFKSRANKIRKLIPKSNTKGLLLGNDPYLVDAVAEKIFPQLTLEGSRHWPGGGNTSLQLITLKEGDRTVTLPSLSLEQNYPQMLSELVSHI